MIDIVVKKKPSDFRLIADAIAYCIISLDVKIGKGILNKDDTVYTIVYFERNYITIWRCPRWIFYMYL